LILAWLHIVKKFKELLSMAMKGRVYRHEQVKAVLRSLWYGLVDDAIAHFRSIDPDLIKDPSKIEALVGYLERNRSWIPNYAMRRRLKLCNSSNPVERTYNLASCLAASEEERDELVHGWVPSTQRAGLCCVERTDKRMAHQVSIFPDF